MSKVIRLNKETVDLLDKVKQEYMDELQREWLYVVKNTEDNEQARKDLKKICLLIEDHKRYTESEWIYMALVALEEIID